MQPFPMPPDEVKSDLTTRFVAAPDVRDWAYDTFIRKGSTFENPDHKHLNHARILFVWSSVLFSKTGATVVGTAQEFKQSGGMGKRELLEATYLAMNGGVDADFVITLCAPYVLRECSPEAICALVEHELYHCAHKKDEFGQPKYHRRTSLPVFGLQGHDVEEFVGVVRRYGAYSPQLMEMKRAMDTPPAISHVRARNAICGCGARV